ncbi:hypothetical protein PR003_g21388 [Phytophthora rubi]|uniref:Uncharacterized protein n=1 Tax=Phytophthora rubi TaxID=129364 RepID=A0A6A4DC96_9STRA|nr:hypothetical protein PR001_g20337 [Phytophthora rubi]KAE9305849.1 hypothetical protein PR003_g21388 [Phytophthora rubi]
MQCPTQVKTSTRARPTTSVLKSFTLLFLLVAKGVEMAEGSDILTTNCSNRCGQSTPCIVQAVDGDSDEYSCLQGYVNLESATLVLNGKIFLSVAHLLTYLLPANVLTICCRTRIICCR